jgi:hypothetical protein
VGQGKDLFARRYQVPVVSASLYWIGTAFFLLPFLNAFAHRSKKDLTFLDKEDILSKTYLKKLFLFQNKISSLPPEIGAFTELQVLFPFQQVPS